MRYLPLIMIFFSTLGCAQEQESKPAAPPPAAPTCDTEKHRQFDFWLGEWQVTSKDQEGKDQLAGHNSITLVHNRCALAENWKSATSNYSGSSYNIYDRANDLWHQTWVDTTGTLLKLDGSLVGGSMVLQGNRPAADGSGKVTHRITWTPNEDGSVRQHWQASKDGETWNTLFDGLYRKVK